MTPKEAQAKLIELRRAVGPQGRVSVTLNDCRWARDEPALSGSIYASWPGDTKPCVDCNADDFEPLLERMAAGWEQHKLGAQAARIKTMALALIRITDEAGACTEAALRMAGFDAAEIAALGDEAIAKADAMAQRGPFRIERSANANAPEAA